MPLQPPVRDGRRAIPRPRTQAVLAILATLATILGVTVAPTASSEPTLPPSAWSQVVTFDEGLRRWVVNRRSDFSTFFSSSAGGQTVAKLVAKPAGGDTIEVRTLISTLARSSQPGEVVTATTRVRTHQPSRVVIEVNEGRYERQVPAAKKASTGRAFDVRANEWTTISASHTARGNLPLTVRIKIDAPRTGDELQVSDLNVAGGGQADSRCAQGISSDPACRVLTWSDDFDDGVIDPAKWRVRDQTTLSYDQARILAENVTESSGVLRIQARRNLTGARPFSTGYVDTIGLFSQKYGRWEMRAKLPTTPGVSRGLWPAFWLRNDSGAGEADIMEAYGGPTDQKSLRSDSYTWTVHEDTNKQFSQQKVSGYGTKVGAPAVADAYHVYAMDWTPAGMRFYFDDVLVGTVRSSDLEWFDRTFDEPMNIRLNLQVGSAWGGFPIANRPDLTRLPANFDVDYVRVYR